jgi:hypothetical protein
MIRWFHCIALTAAGGLSLVAIDNLTAQEPGWTPRVLKLGEEREVSEQTPILERPYRPLHFYGNAVRRNYYRGNPWPLPRDILITTAFLAPTPREREAQLEQRLAEPSLQLPEADQDESRPDAEGSETSGAAETATEAAPEANPRESQPGAELPTADSVAPSPKQALADGSAPARPTPTEPSSRRGRRNR